MLPSRAAWVQTCIGAALHSSMTHSQYVMDVVVIWLIPTLFTGT